MTFGITTFYIKWHYSECNYGECRDLFIVILNGVTLSVVMLSVAVPTKEEKRREKKFWIPAKCCHKSYSGLVTLTPKTQWTDEQPD